MLGLQPIFPTRLAGLRRLLETGYKFAHPQVFSYLKTQINIIYLFRFFFFFTGSTSVHRLITKSVAICSATCPLCSPNMRATSASLKTLQTYGLSFLLLSIVYSLFSLILKGGRGQDQHQLTVEESGELRSPNNSASAGDGLDQHDGAATMCLSTTLNSSVVSAENVDEQILSDDVFDGGAHGQQHQRQIFNLTDSVRRLAVGFHQQNNSGNQQQQQQADDEWVSTSSESGTPVRIVTRLGSIS